MFFHPSLHNYLDHHHPIIIITTIIIIIVTIYYYPFIHAGLYKNQVLQP